MKRLAFELYAPARAGLPWLAVVLSGKRPVDVFACDDEDGAARLLKELRARHEWKVKASFQGSSLGLSRAG